MNNVGLHIDRPAVYAAHEVNSGALGDVGDFAGVGGHAGGNVAEREEEAAVGIAVQLLIYSGFPALRWAGYAV